VPALRPPSPRSAIDGLLQATLAAVMCLSLITPSTPAQAETAPPLSIQLKTAASARQPYQSGQLRGDDRILHVLNRFTFALVPETSKPSGPWAWKNGSQQLHPEALDQTDLNARLASSPPCS